LNEYSCVPHSGTIKTDRDDIASNRPSIHVDYNPIVQPIGSAVCRALPVWPVRHWSH